MYNLDAGQMEIPYFIYGEKEYFKQKMNNSTFKSYSQ